MITLRQLGLRRGAKLVLSGVDLTLNPGEKASLVGRNGAGKSSLFSLLAGRLHADVGDVAMPPGWQIGEVAQSMPEGDEPATEFVLAGDLPLQRAQALLAAAEAAQDGHAMAEAHVALADAGAFDARSRAQALLMGLGFGNDALDQPVNTFSGGWRMRLQLARALMCPADLLLLDEPTNHLDLDALVWLEGWLKRFAGTMLVISHDREFLDAVTQVTLHLEEAQVTRYRGNYSAFESMRAERLSQTQAAFERQQERIAHLQRFIDRFKAKATKAKQAQSRVKALSRMERVAPILTAADFAFEFREPPSCPNPMLVLREVDCGYPGEHADEAPRVIVHGASLTLMAGQRIGILGANGQGKSTLVKTIAGALAPQGGVLTEGKGLRVGYFAQQEMDLLHGDDTPLQRMVRLARELTPQATEQELRNFLGQFRFAGDMVNQRVDTLSGGERARLVLATIVWQRPNLLLLDEPTNHLDLDTRGALSLALNEFEGTLLLVSHDRALLREVCDGFWLVAAGQLQSFDGDLDDYQRWVQDRERQRQRPGAEASPVASGAHPAAQAQSRDASDPSPDTAHAVAREARPPADRKARAAARQRLADVTRPLRHEMAEIDKRLARLTDEKTETETLLATPGGKSEDMAEWGRRLHHVMAEQAMLEERWLTLGEELETLQAEAGSEG
jgi:ATP-binding cassette subfamily F protein 3